MTGLSGTYREEFQKCFTLYGHGGHLGYLTTNILSSTANAGLSLNLNLFLVLVDLFVIGHRHSQAILRDDL